MTTTKKPARLKTWPNPAARKAAYEEILHTYWKINGHEFVPPERKEGEGIEYQDRYSQAYDLYTNSARDRLKGMVTIAALVEGKTYDEVLRKAVGI